MRIQRIHKHILTLLLVGSSVLFESVAPGRENSAVKAGDRAYGGGLFSKGRMQGPSSRHMNLFNRIRRHIDKKEYARARSLLASEELKRSRDPDVLTSIALLYYSMKDYASALSFLEKTHEIEPENEATIQGLFRLHMRLGRTGQAEEYLKLVREKFPDSLATRLHCYIYDVAVPDASCGEGVVTMNFSEAGILANWLKREIDDFMAILSIKQFRELCYLVLTGCRADEPPSTEQHAEVVREVMAESLPALLERMEKVSKGIVMSIQLTQGGNVQQALTALHSALGAGLIYPEAVRYEALLYRKMGQPHIALQLVDQWIQRGMSDFTLEMLYCVLLMQNERIDEALSYVQALMERHPDDPAVNEIYGSILLMSNRPEQARRQLEQALLLAPDNLQVRFYLACAEAMLGNMQNANDLLLKFAQRNRAELVRMLRMPHGYVKEVRKTDVARYVLRQSKRDWIEQRGRSNQELRKPDGSSRISVF